MITTNENAPIYPPLIPKFLYALPFVWLIHLPHEERSKFMFFTRISNLLVDIKRQEAIITCLGHAMSHFLDTNVIHLSAVEFNESEGCYKAVLAQNLYTLCDGNGLIRQVAYAYSRATGEPKAIVIVKFDEKGIITHPKKFSIEFDQNLFSQISSLHQLTRLVTSYEVYGSSVGYSTD